jgi:hypothetical protein
MADPMTIGMAAMGGMQLLGTGMQVQGQLAQADTYSRLADIDTQAVNEQGELALQAGFEQAKEIRKEGRYLLADQRVTAAAGGIKADTGSPLLLAAETARNIELDAMTSEYEGMKQRKLAERQAALIQYDKRLVKRNASQQAFGTILGGVTKAGSSFMGAAGYGAPTLGGRNLA